MKNNVTWQIKVDLNLSNFQMIDSDIVLYS